MNPFSYCDVKPGLGSSLSLLALGSSRKMMLKFRYKQRVKKLMLLMS